MPATTLYTVGHGNRTTEELVAVLRSADVGRLVDVRRYPGSRRHPHFGEERLRQSLPSLGVAYEWRGEELGGRRRPTAHSRHPAWRNDAFRGYADHTDTPAFREALTRLLNDLPLAVMCAESLWWNCHRRLIADAAVVRGATVVHLLSPTEQQQHPRHPALRVGDDGWPVYDVAVAQELELE